MRRWVWPPSRPSANRPSWSTSKTTPRAIRSRTVAGASSTRARTAAVRQRPRPAAIVSAAWRSGESSGSSAAASPPWAQKLALCESGVRETRQAWAPCSAARSALQSPAAPPPTTATSNSPTGAIGPPPPGAMPPAALAAIPRPPRGPAPARRRSSLPRRWPAARPPRPVARPPRPGLRSRPAAPRPPRAPAPSPRARAQVCFQRLESPLRPAPQSASSAPISASPALGLASRRRRLAGSGLSTGQLARRRQVQRSSRSQSITPAAVSSPSTAR